MIQSAQASRLPVSSPQTGTSHGTRKAPRARQKQRALYPFLGSALAF